VNPENILNSSKEHIERVRQKATTSEALGPFWKGMLLAALNTIDAQRDGDLRVLVPDDVRADPGRHYTVKRNKNHGDTSLLRWLSW
jgi:hypothetical protein